MSGGKITGNNTVRSPISKELVRLMYIRGCQRENANLLKRSRSIVS